MIVGTSPPPVAPYDTKWGDRIDHGTVQVLVVVDATVVSMDFRYKLEALSYSVPACQYQRS